MVASQEAFMNWESGFVINGKAKIHYYRTGGDKPAIVLNHGAGDDGLCWTRIALGLEDSYDVIMPDARGHGKSGSGKGDYTTGSRAADLKALLDELKFENPMIAGHSMGADTCLKYAATWPDTISGLIMEDPPVLLEGEVFSERETPVEVEDAGRMIAMFMLYFKLMPRLLGKIQAEKSWPDYPQSDIVPWIDSKKRVSFDFLRAMTGAGFEGSDPFGDVQKVNVPVLLFIGDRKNGSIVTPEGAAELKRLNNNVQIVRLEDASHDIHRTRFDGYIEKLREFLGSQN